MFISNVVNAKNKSSHLLGWVVSSPLPVLPSDPVRPMMEFLCLGDCSMVVVLGVLVRSVHPAGDMNMKWSVGGGPSLLLPRTAPFDSPISGWYVEDCDAIDDSSTWTSICPRFFFWSLCCLLHQSVVGLRLGCYVVVRLLECSVIVCGLFLGFNQLLMFVLVVGWLAVWY